MSKTTDTRDQLADLLEAEGMAHTAARFVHADLPASRRIASAAADHLDSDGRYSDAQSERTVAQLRRWAAR